MKLFLLSEYASIGGHLDIMKVLIQHGARLSENKRILDISVSGGYHEIVDFLLSQDCVDFKNKVEALREATINGHLCVIKTLISHGQSLPSTILHTALAYTRLEIAQLLLAKELMLVA